MHILVVNDDGPPSDASSPYVHSMVSTLQEAGHVVSVVLPNVQRSWIGKAHFINQVLTPSYYRPGTLFQYDGSVHERPLAPGESGEEWVLVDSTPAACVHLGLWHFFRDRGPVDLVLSGPNYGRNSSTLYQLASGTIGGAMEAANFRQRAIALSFAYAVRENVPEAIAATARQALKIIEHLCSNWASDVEVYSVNVPVRSDVEQRKTMITYSLENYWSGSLFTEIPDSAVSTTLEGARLENAGPAAAPTNEPDSSRPAPHSKHVHRQFKWAPRFGDVRQAVIDSEPGNDGKTVDQGHSSITPLRAGFMTAKGHALGELKLHQGKVGNIPEPKFEAYVAYEDEYVQPLILSALSPYSADHGGRVSSKLPHGQDDPSSAPVLQISTYETIDHAKLLSMSKLYYANAYTIRKALTRKNFLAHTIQNFVSKNHPCLLAKHVPLTLSLELDYAEFLDEALLEAYELHESWARNEHRDGAAREWWILKPAMSDKGHGLRLFSTEAELRSIFEEWEPRTDDEDEDDDDQTIGLTQSATSTGFDHSREQGSSDAGMTSQLRHFVVQPYIAPLLFPTTKASKFHIRTYVLCIGALRVYMYREMLALFASAPYTTPESSVAVDMTAHLTNTGLQVGDSSDNVHRFWDLPANTHKHASRGGDWKNGVFEDMKTVVRELFEAAVAQPTNFQPLPNAFEIFGIDWLVDEGEKPWLLEVNAFPDFGQTGDRLKDLVSGLWTETVGRAMQDFFGLDVTVSDPKMELVVDMDIGRR